MSDSPAETAAAQMIPPRAGVGVTNSQPAGRAKQRRRVGAPSASELAVPRKESVSVWPQHTAIVMPRSHSGLPRWMLFVPLLGARQQVGALRDAPDLAATLIRDATGDPVAADDVEMLTAYPGDVMLPSVPAPTLIRHPVDEQWYSGRRQGWASQFGRWWRPVVCYQVGSALWERIAAPGTWRLDRPSAGAAHPPSPLQAAPTVPRQPHARNR